MKTFFKLDYLFISIFVFCFIGILALVSVNTHFFSPVTAAFSDVKFNDLAFSTFLKKKQKDERIVIINIGNYQRAEIAGLLMQLDKCKPAVIGLDVLFKEKTNERVDSFFRQAIKKIPSLVLSSQLEMDEEKKLTVVNYFHDDAVREGYVNFQASKNEVVRFYRPYYNSGDSMLPAFTSQIAKLGDAKAYEKLKKRGHDINWINYRRDTTGYYIIPGSTIMSGKFDPSFFKEKIILVGLVNNSATNIDDKHFTPLNEKFAGKSLPDMNGVIIQANIISMILRDDYITKLPWGISLLAAFLFVWIQIVILAKYFTDKNKHKWFHLVVKIFEIAVGIFLLYLGLRLLYNLNCYLDFTLTSFATVLTVDAFYFYEPFAHWLTEMTKNWKHPFKSIFTHSEK